MTDTQKNFSQDEELSDFTDRLLKGQMKPSVPETNVELKDLQETILRLHSNMPSAALEESTKKQMLVRLNARIRREKAQPQSKTFWSFLFGPSSSRIGAAALGVLVLLIIAVLLVPALGSLDGSSTVATALSGTGSLVLPALLLGLIILVLWIKRKK